jgi:hypothetical protein
MPRPATKTTEEIMTVAQPEPSAPIDWVPDTFEAKFGYGNPIGNVYHAAEGYKTLQGKPAIPYRNAETINVQNDRAQIKAFLDGSDQRWTAGEIAKELNMPRVRVSNAINRLLNGCYSITKIGAGNNTKYCRAGLGEQECG